MGILTQPTRRRNLTQLTTRNGITLPAWSQTREDTVSETIRESVYGKVEVGNYFDGIVSFHDQEAEVRSGGETLYFNWRVSKCFDYAQAVGLLGAWNFNLSTRTEDEKQESAAASSCAFHSCIRRFYAIAGAMGLDTTQRERIRAAFSRYLDCKIESRKELTASQWLSLGDACERGELAW